MFGYKNDIVKDMQIVDEDVKNNKATIITYKKSFTARLCQANEQTKVFYFELMTNILAHKKVHSRISWNFNTFTYRRNKLVRINVKNNTIYLYLNLDINEYLDSKYTLIDVSDKKRHQNFPLLFKVKGKRTFKYAFKLLEDLYEKFALVDTYLLLDYNKFTIEYLNRPLAVLKEEGYVKEVRRTMNLTRAIKKQEELAKELRHNILVYAKMVNYNYNGDMYLVGNTIETGNWDPKKALKMRHVSDYYYEINLKMNDCHFEFKLLNQKDFLGVEKGIWAEEIRNHIYDIEKDMVIEDLVHHFRNESEF